MVFVGFIIFRENFGEQEKWIFASIFEDLTLFAKFIFCEKMRFVFFVQHCFCVDEHFPSFVNFGKNLVADHK